MSVIISELTDEIQNDPLSLGYATYVASGNDQAIADLLNTPGVGAAYSIFRKSVSIRELIANIAAAEFASMTSLQLQKLQLVFLDAATLDATDANTRNIIQGIFTGMSSTLSNFAVVSKKQGSRAEILWGEGSTVSISQVAAALGRG